MKVTYLTPEKEILRELGQRFAQIRRQQGISQPVLAEEAGIGVATLRRIEAGKDSQMESWIKIMKAIGMIGNVNSFLPEEFNSPMAEVKADRKRHRKTEEAGRPLWGDEQ